MNEFIKFDPFRVVSWRWERAVAIARGLSALSRRRDDAWIKRAADFHRLMTKAGNKKAQKHLLIERHPEIFYAHHLYMGREDEGRQATPYMIEARVLARQTPEQVAKAVCVEQPVVEAYLKLFFDVEERLDAIDYIYQAVMGPGINRGNLRMRAFDVLWKLAGYCGGVHILESIRDPFPRNFADTVDDVDATYDMNVRRNSRRLSNLASSSISVSDNMTSLGLMEHWRQMVSDEAKGGGSNEAKSKNSANVQAMLGTLRFSVGVKGPTSQVNPDIRTYDSLGAELRGDELIKVSLGQGAVDVERLKTLRYPEKKAETPTLELPAPK